MSDSSPKPTAECPCHAASVSSDLAFADSVTRLVHRHRAALARLARREGLGPEDAVDAVQEAFAGFLGLARARELCDAPEEARNLLVALTRNVARNRRRLHSAARPHVSDAALVEGLADGAPGPDVRLALGEATGRFATCVHRLADVQRAVVTLRLLDERPGEDVAALLGLRPGHVAVLLHRAKASLQSCMSEEPGPN